MTDTNDNMTVPDATPRQVEIFNNPPPKFKPGQEVIYLKKLYHGDIKKLKGKLGYNIYNELFYVSYDARIAPPGTFLGLIREKKSGNTVKKSWQRIYDWSQVFKLKEYEASQKELKRESRRKPEKVKPPETESAEEPWIYYIDFLNKDKGFKEDRIEFSGPDANNEAVKWARENLEKYDPDMIKIKNSYAEGGSTDDGIDLFDHPENYTQRLKRVFGQKKNRDILEHRNNNPELIAKMLKQTQIYGYTFDIDSDGWPVNLRRMNMAKGGDVELDAHIKAKRPGYRVPGTNKPPTKQEIKEGKAYYETRFNRSDENRRTYPYLEKGGMLPIIEIRKMEDGFEWVVIPQETAESLWDSNNIEIFEIYDDGSESLIESKDDLYNAGTLAIEKSSLPKSAIVSDNMIKMAKGGDVELDAQIKAKRPGYRIPGTNKPPTKQEIKEGKAYYETRFNRSDENRRTYPYLKKGGNVDDESSSVAEIAYRTGLRAQAVRKFQEDFSIPESGMQKIADGLRTKKLLYMDVTTAVAGKPGNRYQKQVVEYAGGSVIKMAHGGKMIGMVQSNKHKND